MRFAFILFAACLGIVLSVPYLWGGEVKASGGAASAATAEPGSRDSLSASPRAVLERFDSLLTDGSPGAIGEARLLTAGAARRLFPLLAETQLKVNNVIDTARSRDTILDEQVVGEWAALKVRADVVFRKPFLGLHALSSIQIIHLHKARASEAWKIVEFEEVADASAPFAPRIGKGPDDSAYDNAPGSPASLLPLSRLAPARADHARVTRLQLRLSRRDGSAFQSLPQGASQRFADGVDTTGSTVEIETVVSPAHDSLLTGRAAHWPDSLALYLASTPDLDVTDKMLRTRAAKLKQGSTSDVETARRVWRYVSTSFDYKLGATLFATSREALRDMRGDCSEAAVLTAALLRAAGIPSRVMLGYASLGQGVWIGHAWVEAWLGGASDSTRGGREGWVGVDAALREFPAGPHRVALVTLSGREDMKAAATNLMLTTIANLDIEITGAWADDTPVPLVTHPAAAEEAQRFWDQVLKGMGE